MGCPPPALRAAPRGSPRAGADRRRGGCGRVLPKGGAGVVRVAPREVGHRGRGVHRDPLCPYLSRPTRRCTRMPGRPGAPGGPLRRAHGPGRRTAGRAERFGGSGGEVPTQRVARGPDGDVRGVRPAQRVGHRVAPSPAVACRGSPGGCGLRAYRRSCLTGGEGTGRATAGSNRRSAASCAPSTTPGSPSDRPSSRAEVPGRPAQAAAAVRRRVSRGRRPTRSAATAAQSVSVTTGPARWAPP